MIQPGLGREHACVSVCCLGSGGVCVGEVIHVRVIFMCVLMCVVHVCAFVSACMRVCACLGLALALRMYVDRARVCCVLCLYVSVDVSGCTRV